MRKTLALLIGAAGLSLGACAYDGAYGGVDLGYGYGGYGYYDPYYASPYYGWYDGFWYPGSGIYVYDRDHRRRVWTSGERSYWTQRSAPRATTRVTTIPQPTMRSMPMQAQPMRGFPMRGMMVRPQRSHSIFGG